MRQLQVVGLSDDGRLLLLAPSAQARPTYAIELDQRLERAVRGQPLDDDDARQQSSLSPRDIQARLRAGASVEQIAKEAGVPVSRIERYAGPVLSEREQVLTAARASTMIRPRGSASLLPLGASIDANVRALAYARPETAEWAAYRRADGEWVVRYDITVRGRRRRAEWAHRPAAREVTALNSYATALGLIEAGRARAAREVSESGPPKPAARVPKKAVAKTAKAFAKAPAMKEQAKKAPTKMVATRAVAKKMPVAKKASTVRVTKTVVAKVPVKKAATSGKTGVRARSGTKPGPRRS